MCALSWFDVLLEMGHCSVDEEAVVFTDEEGISPPQIYWLILTDFKSRLLSRHWQVVGGGSETKVNKTPRVPSREDSLTVRVRWYLTKVWKLKARIRSLGIWWEEVEEGMSDSWAAVRRSLPRGGGGGCSFWTGQHGSPTDGGKRVPQQRAAQEAEMCLGSGRQPCYWDDWRLRSIIQRHWCVSPKLWAFPLYFEPLL